MSHSLPKRLAIVLGLLSLLIPISLATSGSASAFQPYSISVGTSNQISVAGCTFKVSSYNALTNTVTGRLVGSIAPRSFSLGLATATVYVGCDLYGDNNGSTTSGHRLQNGSSTSFNNAVTVPYDTSYTLCVSAATLTRGGVTYNAPYNCR